MRSLISTLALIATFIIPPAEAQESRIDTGVALAIDAANGEPANDIPGAGVLAHFELNDEWTIAAAVNRTEYDYERPAQIVGIAQDPTVEVIDALAEATTVRLWLERSMTDRTRPTHFFVGAGIGAAFTDVPDVAGPRADGGRFDIRTEVDTEIIASVIGGARRKFGKRWYGEAAVRVEQHFADWRSIDRISGAQGRIDDYLTWGGHLAVGFRW